MNVPLISVIICTYNRANLLDNCLASLCEQQLDGDLYEIIVVDNNSKDDTSDVASSYMRKNGNIRYVIEENQGHSYARNRGCDEARGEYLVYVDDDVIAPSEYLSAIVEVITEHQPDILGGPVYPHYTSPKPRWFKDKYETKKYEGKSGFSSTCSITGCNYIIKKDVLRQLGMFDVTLGMKGDQLGLGDDRAVLEVYRRETPEAEQKVYYALECYVGHQIPPYKMTLKYMAIRYYQVGRMAARVKQKPPSWALGFILNLIPNLISDLFYEIRAHGLGDADYVGVLLRALARLGNIVELLSHGIKPVFGHIFKWMSRKT